MSVDLWTAAAATSARARASGALAPIDTREAGVVDHGVRFSVRQVEAVRLKRALPPRPPGFDPFDDPEPDLRVLDDWTPGYRVILNKFPVFADHLLLVTRGFVAQEDPLGDDDFAAAWAALDAADGLIFYNGGPRAGASQPRRHLQLVRTPLATGPEPYPTVDWLLRQTEFPVWGTDKPARDRACSSSYREGLRALGLTAGDPYNLLLTRERLVVVPRTAEHAAGISLNALGYAGSIYVRDDGELQRVRERGPVALLREASIDGTPPVIT